MTRRLLLSYLGLALAVLVVLEVPLAVLAANHERSAMLVQAEREATGLAVVTGEDISHGRVAEVADIARQYRARTGGEVAIVDARGAVTAASGPETGRDATGDQSLMVAQALTGQSSSELISEKGRPLAAAAVPVVVGGRPEGAVLLDRPAQGLEARVHEIWLVLGLFAAGVLGLTGLVGVLLARSVSRPLAQLEVAVGRLGKGDLSARAAVADGPMEVRSLGLQFNRMAAQLSELVEAQNRFIADASHQLRSPLTALRLRLENLELALEAPLAETVEAASQEVLRLSRVVDGLLALTRAGTDQPQREPVDVGRVISERCSAWSALAEERHVALNEGKREGPGPVAMLVPGDLDQMLDNLLANALDACPDGSRVRLEVVPTGTDRAEVHVVDNGPGLAPEDRKRAFERFWQGTSSRQGADGAAGGNGGLGLAIVRQLAERNGVEVELRPAAQNGLDAVVTLPLIRASDRATASSEPSSPTERLVPVGGRAAGSA
jgi:signal transduction histidine kinase